MTRANEDLLREIDCQLDMGVECVSEGILFGPNRDFSLSRLAFRRATVVLCLNIANGVQS